MTFLRVGLASRSSRPMTTSSGRRAGRPPFQTPKGDRPPSTGAARCPSRAARRRARVARTGAARRQVPRGPELRRRPHGACTFRRTRARSPRSWADRLVGRPRAAAARSGSLWWTCWPLRGSARQPRANVLSPACRSPTSGAPSTTPRSSAARRPSGSPWRRDLRPVGRSKRRLSRPPLLELVGAHVADGRRLDVLVRLAALLGPCGSRSSGGHRPPVP